MLKNLAIWYLRKKKCAVMINCKINGDSTFLTNDHYMYESILHGKIYTKNGKEFTIPTRGKYKMSFDERDL